MYCKAKKNFGAICKFLKNYIFLEVNLGLKGGISIDSLLTFFKIGCGHTVIKVVAKFHMLFHNQIEAMYAIRDFLQPVLKIQNPYCIIVTLHKLQLQVVLDEF